MNTHIYTHIYTYIHINTYLLLLFSVKSYSDIIRAQSWVEFANVANLAVCAPYFQQLLFCFVCIFDLYICVCVSFSLAL